VATSLWFVRTPLRALRAAVLILWLPLVTLAVYSLPYMKSRAEVGERPMSDVVGYSASAMDFLSAPANNVLYGWTDELSTNERHLFPGSSRRCCSSSDSGRHSIGRGPSTRLPSRSRSCSRWASTGDSTAAVRLGAALQGTTRSGAGRHPCAIGHVGARGFRPERAMSVMTSQRMAAMAAAASVTLASVECLARPTLIPANPDASVWYAWLRTVPDAVVFEWPVTVPWRLYDMRDVRYMYRSTLHWRPMLNGYSGHYPESYVKLLYTMRDFPYTPALLDLRRRGATVLILHDVEGSRPSYDQALERLVRDPNIRLIAEDLDAGRRVIFLRLLPAAVNFSVFRERATASATMTMPHASSAATCGHSTCHPTPFRKIPRTMMMK
jgi:hypothetical protein